MSKEKTVARQGKDPGPSGIAIIALLLSIILLLLTAVVAVTMSVITGYTRQAPIIITDLPAGLQSTAKAQLEFAVVPLLIISAISIIGLIIITNERKTAKGIWFSNPEELR